MSEQAENSGDHFEMYKSPDALCCVPATTSTGGQIHFKNKLTERDEICGYQAQSGGGAGGRWSKVQTCSCKISTTDVMCTMTNVINMLYVIYES